MPQASPQPVKVTCNASGLGNRGISLILNTGYSLGSAALDN